jgi:cytochrome oxidase Cu insertion factor (SCO1/SenC/PrrC family)
MVRLDPAHDAPPALRRYGLQYLHGDAPGFDYWEFVTLSSNNLRRMATSIGVTYQAARDGGVVHTTDVSLIGPNSTPIKSWGGDDWNPEVIAKAVEAAAQETSDRD